jgi:hypothetical protein
MAQTGSMVMGTEAASNLLFITNATEAARLDSSGNLGLGVTPSAWGSGIKSLQVGNYTALTNNQGGYVWLSGNAYYDTGWKYLTLNRALYYAQDVSDGGHKWFNAPSGSANAAITFTQAMTLTAAGNLGLGTTSPTSISNQTSLTIKGTDVSRLDMFQGSTDTAGLVASSTATYLETRTATPLVFITNNTERARINANGSLLIGKTSEDITIPSFQYRQDIQSLAITTSSSGISNAYLTRTANTGNFVSFLYSTSLTNVGSISTDGSSTAYNTSSDRRLKTNIISASDAGSDIDAINVVSHGWVSNDDTVKYGVIAQELFTVAPQAVRKGDDGAEVTETWGVDYSKLVPMLVKEIQSLRKRLADAGI